MKEGKERGEIPAFSFLNRNMRPFKEYLIESLLLEAKIDDYVNRYLKHHEEHKTVKENKEYAEKAIRATHGIGSSHHENVFLTRGVLDGSYIPGEDEGTMRATLGSFRRAVQQGYMGREDIANHDHHSLNRVFEGIAEDNPDFDPTETPIKGNPPIHGLEKYKVGTIMPYSETKSRRIDQNLPMHVYHVHHSDILQQQNPKGEYRKISKLIDKNCPKDASICVRHSPEHLQRYSTGHGFFMYVQGGRIVRAHGYGDHNGIVDHRNGAVSGAESAHLMTETSPLLSKSKKFVYDVHRLNKDYPGWDQGPAGSSHMGTEKSNELNKRISQLFDGVSHEDLKQIYDEEAKNHKKSLEQSKMTDIYYPGIAAQSGYKEQGWLEPKMMKHDTRREFERRYGVRGDTLRNHLDQFTTKKSDFLDTMHRIVKNHLVATERMYSDESLDSDERSNFAYQKRYSDGLMAPHERSRLHATPLSHPDFLRHVAMNGRGMDLKKRDEMETAFVNSQHFGPSDLDALIKRHEDSTRKQKSVEKRLFPQGWGIASDQTTGVMGRMHELERYSGSRASRYSLSVDRDPSGYYHTGNVSGERSSTSRIIEAISKGQRKGWLTKEQMERAWNIQPAAHAREHYRDSLIATGSPLITSDMLDNYLSGRMHMRGLENTKGNGNFPLIARGNAAFIFLHPNHTREHVDHVLRRIEIANKRDDESLASTGRHNVNELDEAGFGINSALMNSKHITDDDMHKLITHPDAINPPRHRESKDSMFATVDERHRRAMERIGLVMMRKDLKPEHIMLHLSNPNLTAANLNPIAQRKDLSVEHQHALLDAADRIHASGKTEGLDWRGNPRKPPHFLEGTGGDSRMVLQHAKHPSVIKRILQTDPKIATNLVRYNPHINDGHIKMMIDMEKQGQMAKDTLNDTLDLWHSRQGGDTSERERMTNEHTISFSDYMMLQEAKIDDFVARWTKHHRDHPLVQNNPDEAKNLIAHAHPFQQNKDEAQFVTTQLLNKTYVPGEHDEDISSTLGKWRRGVARGLIKGKQLSDFSSHDDLMGFIGNYPQLRLIDGLEKYHIGKIRNPEPRTKHDEELDVYHFFGPDIEKHHAYIFRRNPEFVAKNYPDDFHEGKISDFKPATDPPEEYGKIRKLMSKSCKGGNDWCVLSPEEGVNRLRGSYTKGSGFFMYVGKDGNPVYAQGNEENVVRAKQSEEIDENFRRSIKEQTHSLLSGPKKYAYRDRVLDDVELDPEEQETLTEKILSDDKMHKDHPFVQTLIRSHAHNPLSHDTLHKLHALPKQLLSWTNDKIIAELVGHPQADPEFVKHHFYNSDDNDIARRAIVSEHVTPDMITQKIRNTQEKANLPGGIVRYPRQLKMLSMLRDSKHYNSKHANMIIDMFDFHTAMARGIEDSDNNAFITHAVTHEAKKRGLDIIDNNAHTHANNAIQRLRAEHGIHVAIPFLPRKNKYVRFEDRESDLVDNFTLENMEKHKDDKYVHRDAKKVLGAHLENLADSTTDPQVLSRLIDVANRHGTHTDHRYTTSIFNKEDSGFHNESRVDPDSHAVLESVASNPHLSDEDHERLLTHQLPKIRKKALQHPKTKPEHFELARSHPGVLLGDQAPFLYGRHIDFKFDVNSLENLYKTKKRMSERESGGQQTTQESFELRVKKHLKEKITPFRKFLSHD